MSASPRSVKRPSQISTLPVTNGLVGDALVAAGVFVGHVPRAGPDGPGVAHHVHIGAGQQARRVAGEHLLVLHFAADHEFFIELVARIDAGAARAGVGRELLADAEAAFGFARPGARLEMFGNVRAFHQPGGRGFGAQRIVRLRLADFGAHARARRWRARSGRQPAMPVSPACAPSCTALAPISTRLFGELGRDAQAGRRLIFAAGAHFVVHDDEDAG